MKQHRLESTYFMKVMLRRDRRVSTAARISAWRANEWFLLSDSRLRTSHDNKNVVNTDLSGYSAIFEDTHKPLGKGHCVGAFQEGHLCMGFHCSLYWKYECLTHTRLSNSSKVLFILYCIVPERDRGGTLLRYYQYLFTYLHVVECFLRPQQIKF